MFDNRCEIREVGGVPVGFEAAEGIVGGIAGGALEDVGYVVGDEVGGLGVGAAEGLEGDEGPVAGPEYATCCVGVEMTIVDCHCEDKKESLTYYF